MSRALHRLVGLCLGLILTVVSLTGFVLSVFPVMNADHTASRLDAGALAEAVMHTVPLVEQILVDDNGTVTAVAFGPEGFVQQVIDPATGAVKGPVTSSATELWFENLHRALFLSDTGHIIILVATTGMILLAISGLWLAARRLGGWRKLFTPDHGAGAGHLHLKLARFAFVGLVISSLSGLWMGASTLGLIQEGSPQPRVPTDVSISVALAPTDLPALRAISGETLRAISFPRAGMTGEAWQVETNAGAGYVDPATGKMLTWEDRPVSSRVMDVMHLLHTGQGASLLGLLLGVMSLSIPVLSASGLIVWLGGRQSGTRITQTAAKDADLIILVGSEGGTTWRFARAFAKAALAKGHGVHICEMNAFRADAYTKAHAILAFAATYGDGDAPSSATDFIARISGMAQTQIAPLTVLGFGDRSYPAYCGYAEALFQAADQRGWAQSYPLKKINRQSVSAFQQWARDWTTATGIPIAEVSPELEPMPVTRLTLTSSQFYGESVQAPTAILRFALPRQTILSRLLRRNWAASEAGDLLNIFPEGSDFARSYSLASSAKDGFLEICVRKKAGGVCSGQLLSLKPGDTVAANLQTNPGFHVPKGNTPLVLIGAGAGIGALCGMIRSNLRHRPIHLFYGSRTIGEDLPYGQDLASWRGTGHLHDLTVAWSRGERPRYVQDAIEDEAEALRTQITQGASIMICGGREMGESVAKALDRSLAPIGVTVDMLIREKRYAADIF